VGKKSVYAAIPFDQYLLSSLLCSSASTHFQYPRYVFHVFNGRDADHGVALFLVDACDEYYDVYDITVIFGYF
jgi:hypothetical protein